MPKLEYGRARLEVSYSTCIDVSSWLRREKLVSTVQINLWLRFGLEVAALIGLALMSWRSSDRLWRWVLVVSAPLIAATFWGAFAVPNDPSRSGNAPVPVPGSVRLILEFTILGVGVAAYLFSGYRVAGAIMVAALLVHYAVSYDRVLWLIRS